MRSNAVLGILVFRDPKLTVMCEARGLWPFQKIVIGPSFERLTTREQGAVLLHEAGHCKLHHTAKRILFVARRPRILFAMLIASIYTAMEGEPDRRMADFAYMRRVCKLAPKAALFAKQQEYEADRYAAGCGYALDLAELYARLSDPPAESFHPDNASRIARLTNMNQGV